MKKLLSIFLLICLASFAIAQRVEIRKKSGGGGSTVRRSNDNMVSNFDPSFAISPLKLNDLCFDQRRGALYRWNGISWQLFFGRDDGQQADVPVTVTNPASNIATGWNASTHNKLVVNYTTAGVDTMRIALPTNANTQVPGEIFVVEMNTTSRTGDADTLLISFDSLFRTYDGHLIGQWKCPPRGRIQMAFRVHVAVEGNQWVEVDDILGSYGHGAGSPSPCTPAYWASSDTTFVRFSDCSIDTVITISSVPTDTVTVDSLNGRLIFTWEGDVASQDTVKLPDITPPIVNISGTATPTLNLQAGLVFKVDYNLQTDLSLAFSNLVAGKEYVFHIRNNLDSVALPYNVVFTTETGQECPVNPITTKNFILKAYSTATDVYVYSSTTPVTCLSLDPAYDSVLVYAQSQGFALPSWPQRVKDSNFVKGGKTAGWWYKQPVFYSFYSDAATSDFTRINWMNPGTFTITAVGGMTWAANVGWSSNGSTGYLSTNWNPATNGLGKFTQNSAAMYVDVQTPGVGGSKFNFGIGALRVEQQTNWRYLINNNSDQTTTGTGGTSGIRAINRSGASATQAYLAGVNVHTGTSSSVAVTSATMSICTFGSDPSFSTASTVKYRMFGAASSLTSTEHASLNALWLAHL